MKNHRSIQPFDSSAWLTGPISCDSSRSAVLAPVYSLAYTHSDPGANVR